MRLVKGVLSKGMFVCLGKVYKNIPFFSRSIIKAIVTVTQTVIVTQKDHQQQYWHQTQCQVLPIH